MESDSSIITTIDMRNINSAQQFAAIFDKDADDGLLLCYEQLKDCVCNADLVYLCKTLQQYALEQKQKLTAELAQNNKFSRHLHLYIWQCSSHQFDDAKQQVNKISGKPLLLVIYRQQIIDSLRPDSLLQLYNGSLANLFHRLIHVQMQASQVIVPNDTASYIDKDEANSTLRINVAKMLDVGKQSMCKGKPHYAQKIFAKAIDLLESMQNDFKNFRGNNLLDADEMQVFDKTYAACLAWAALAQLVQGKNVPHKSKTQKQSCTKSWEEQPKMLCSGVSSNVQHTITNYLQRLQSRHLPYYRFCKIPLSDQCRVCALAAMMTAAPKVWSSQQCSVKKLQAALSLNPHDHDNRAALIITYFLAGDIQRALTEAIKLKVLHLTFGEVAIAQITHFLGETHQLLKQL